jgi:membrane associated rhomboid family serine protease
LLSQTLILIIITALVSVSAFNSQKVYDDLIMYPPAVDRGQFWRLLTSGFIHADWQHLLFNMLTLYFFGEAIEAVMQTIAGPFGFWGLYLGGILVSDIPSYLKNRGNSRYASLGASGGVSSVVFAFILFAPWSWFSFPPVPAIVYGIGYLWYCVYMSKRGSDNVNHDAHFWGALYGIVFTIVAQPTVLTYFFNQLMHPQGP